MVTKWRKSKVLISFIVFVVGTSLILSSGLGRGIRLIESSGARSEFRDAFEEDYQNTADFRWYMSDYLEEFLVMAVGGPLTGSDDGVVYAGEGYSYGWNNGISPIYVRDSYSSWNDYSWTNSEDEAFTDIDGDVETTSFAAMAKQIHESYKDDKNILYTISYDGAVKFTNADGTGLSGSVGTLPEGYNFLLYFDGEKVTIYKDGKQQDVYGSGYYTEDSLWYVPGYTNFMVDDETQKATVCIAAAKNPMIYVKGNYADDGAAHQYNRLYWLQENLQQRRESYIASGISLAAGIALFALYIVWRKDKKCVDQRLAKWTAKLWVEVKLLAVLPALLTLLQSFHDSPWEIIYMIQEDGYHLSDFFDYEGGMGALLTVLWLLYLFVNDLRYNEKVWKHNLISRIADLVCGTSLAMPLQKRMIRRYGVTLGMQAAVGCIAAAAFMIYLNTYLYYYDVIMYVVPFAVIMLVLVLLPGFLYASKNKALARDVGALAEQVESVREGNLKQPAELPEDTELLGICDNLNDIQHGMREALEQQTKSERMKVELITNVSHDLKTPLTSIITYAELLEEEEGLPDHVKDYVHILNTKARRLRSMVLDVFEVSKAASGQLPVDLEALDLGKLLRQTLADMGETIEASPVTIRTDIPEEPVMIVADGKRLYRVFQNLIQNSLQYSLDGSRVYVSLKADGHRAEASVKNTSRVELGNDIDFTERFVRGDESRSDGGSGLGLSIASNFTEACGGQLKVEPIADLFVVTAEFDQIPRG